MILVAMNSLYINDNTLSTGLHTMVNEEWSARHVWSTAVDLRWLTAWRAN